MPSRIQPMIITADIARAATFYREVLGAVETQRMPAEGEVFSLTLVVGGDAELGLVSDDKAPSAPGPVLLNIEVDDVDALVPLVREHGGDAAEPTDMPWGQRVAHVKDPDGNLLNLTQSI